MNLEGIVLTGGASRRMGTDKASILVEGEPLGHRIARLLSTRCERVTILGREPIKGFEFLQDESEFAGPLAALSRFQPQAALVFIASCDLMRFEPGLIDELQEKLGANPAAVPVIEDRPQPLCALYRASALMAIRPLVESGEQRIMTWLSSMSPTYLHAHELTHSGACLNFNVPGMVSCRDS